MNEGVRVAALIPARSGSKGIPGKNLSELGGRSLLEWAIELAQDTPEIDRCIVSTDGPSIALEAARLGAEVHPRPAKLAEDSALVIDTIIDVRGWHKAVGDACEQFVLLQPTSPFRTPSVVRRCLQALARGADSVATVAPASLHPHQAFYLGGDRPRPFIEDAFPWLPRQSLRPPAYQLTGAVYAFWIERLLLDSPSLLFGDARAVTTDGPIIDIDEPDDLHVAEALLKLGADSLAP